MISPTSTVKAASDVARFVDQLHVSAPHVVINTDVDSRRSRSKDRWPEAAKWTDTEEDQHLPAAVLRPSNTQEVSMILRAASKEGIFLVPFGAGSGVVGGVVNEGVFVSLDLGGLTGVPKFDDARSEVTVGAGMLGADLEDALNRRGRRIPHYPQSLALASVGGLVATRSSGTFSSKYGNIEDLVVALEVVLADGTVISTRSVPRSSTGPALAQLFIGSEGILGVITSVTLRTFPKAIDTRFRGVAFAILSEGIDAIRAILDRGIKPAVIRLYDAAEADHLYERSGIVGNGRSLLILGFDGDEMVVDAEQSASLDVAASHHGVDLGSGPGETWERTRFDATWFDRGNADDSAFADAIEVSASWPILGSLHDRVLETMRPHVDYAYAHFSHFYPNGGAIYFIFFTTGGDRTEALGRYRKAWAATLQMVLEAGGSMSHHHGVGEARKEWMTSEHGGSLRILAAIKDALDPQGILSPGKLGIERVSERNGK